MARIASATGVPCATRTSTWRSLEMISSGVCLFLPIVILLWLRSHTSGWTTPTGADHWDSISDESDKAVLWVAQSVFLALYRERATGRPRLALTVSADESRLEYDRVIDRVPYGTSDRSFTPAEIDEDEPERLACVEAISGSGYLLWDVPSLRWRGRSKFAGVLHLLPGETSLDLAFSPVGRKPGKTAETVFRPLFDDRPSAYSPA